MAGIFLSYRRDDASGWAGRLYEHLVRDLGSDSVFMDVDTIAPGEDFREAIARTIEASDAVLVVMGPGWATAHDGMGNRRLDDEADVHRTEITSALAAGVRVVPVLVGGASMPSVADLPEPVRALAYRNAAVIDDRRFAADASRLVDVLRPRGAGPVWVSPSAGEPRSVAVPEAAPSATATVTSPVRVDGEARERRSARPAVAWPTIVLAGCALAVLVWGVVVPREWHPELWGVRVGAGLLLVVLVGVGFATNRWAWMAVGGAAGTLGLMLWMAQLLAGGHTVEDLLSPAEDGVPNLLFLAGALGVLMAAVVGARMHPEPRS